MHQTSVFRKFAAIAVCLFVGIAVPQLARGSGKTVRAFAQNYGDACKACYLTDFDTQTPVYAKNERQRLPIASMCKIMTALLCFEEIDAGNLSLEECVPVSRRAEGMGGSQIYLEAGGSYTASELIKSIVVCSANDSCVAMAERVSGSEEAFVERMNTRAEELGLEDTLFSNCTGLPKDPQYSCARDVSVMLCELLKHGEYYKYSQVRHEMFSHPNGRQTEMTNTNKLLNRLDGCDGGKTGFTNQAGFCMAATARRGSLRLISVVIGSTDSKSRFSAAEELIDYGFANYVNRVVVDETTPIEQTVSVRGGKCESVAVVPERASYLFERKNEKSDVKIDVCLKAEIKAPILQGDVLGELTVYKDGLETDTVRLIAASGVERITLWDSVKKVAQNWR